MQGMTIYIHTGPLLQLCTLTHTPTLYLYACSFLILRHRSNFIMPHQWVIYTMSTVPTGAPWSGDWLDGAGKTAILCLSLGILLLQRLIKLKSGGVWILKYPDTSYGNRICTRRVRILKNTASTYPGGASQKFFPHL